MTTGHRLPIFVSSAHYGLEDLRAEVTEFLNSLGVQPFVSSEAGFPDHPGMPPYAGCLKTLEHSLMVVGIVDRRYGVPFDDWGPYPEYAGLSPTHAELRHALALGKRVVIYVREDVASFYELYRRNPEEMKSLKLPTGLDLKSLEMYQELKWAKPAPWIESFRDVRALKASLQQRLLNDLYELMLQREATSSAAVTTIVDAFLKSDSALREAVAASADAEVTAQLAKLETQLEEVSKKREELDAAHAENTRAQDELTAEAERLTTDRVRLQTRVNSAVAQAIASALSAGLQPSATSQVAGPGTLPLVTDQELARGGIHFSGYSQRTPTVTRVTWARLPRRDSRGVGRGYDACLQIFGENFAPGCKIQSRRQGSSEDPTFGWVPNVFSGHYLELSTNDSDETPIGDLALEYRVINPFPGRSEWVPFSYSFDEDVELQKAAQLLEQGQRLLESNDPGRAVEPLRSAQVRLRGLVGEEDERWKQAHASWKEALAQDRAARAATTE